eukprot:m.161334 g.161334  ORF g.161334 m.161334 type:complete len:98 (+) comp38815_c0_seq6:416-709(+)
MESTTGSKSIRVCMTLGDVMPGGFIERQFTDQGWLCCLCLLSLSAVNAFALDTSYKTYDRIVCGGACPKEKKLGHFVAMLKIDGKLIVPCDDEVNSN